MTQAAFNRDNILSPEDRVASARKCLAILADARAEDFKLSDWEFLEGQRKAAKYVGYQISERQLMWLRDIVSKHL